MSKRNLAIAGILLLALSVRIYVSFLSGLQWYTADTHNYYNFADALKSGEYKQPYMPPGYSFLVLMFDHFGNRDLTMIIFNIAASVLACLFVYFICFKITASKKLGLLAMGIMAVYPNNVNYVRYLSSEVPAMFFLTASVFLILCFKGNLPSVFLSGLALGMAGIIRVTCLPVIFFYLLALLPGKKYARLCGYLISFLIPVIIALGINYYHTKRMFIYDSFFAVPIVSTEFRSDNLYLDGTKDPRYQKIFNEKNINGAWLVYFKAFKDNPREWVVKRLISAWELWGPYPSSDNGRRSVLTRIVIGSRFILLILAICGGYFLMRRNRAQFLILSGPIITITLLHVLSFSVARYTHVVEPLAICLALCVFSILRSRSYNVEESI